jgi:hypothetical protein
MRSARYLLALIALVLVASSCGDDSTGPDGGTADSIFGTYDLVTIDGSDLPWEDPQGLVMIVGGFMRLNADSTCVFRLDLEIMGNITGFIESGTYTIDGSSIDFIFDSFDPLSGTLIGNTLTVGDGAITYVFRK